MVGSASEKDADPDSPPPPPASKLQQQQQRAAALLTAPLAARLDAQGAVLQQVLEQQAAAADRVAELAAAVRALEAAVREGAATAKPRGAQEGAASTHVVGATCGEHAAAAAGVPMETAAVATGGGMGMDPLLSVAVMLGAVGITVALLSLLLKCLAFFYPPTASPWLKAFLPSAAGFTEIVAIAFLLTGLLFTLLAVVMAALASSCRALSGVWRWAFG